MLAAPEVLWHHDNFLTTASPTGQLSVGSSKAPPTPPPRMTPIASC
ncbi:unnamed protein product [Gulo gulo]|uniref:Uncharacterized protein n=1 Tax=Gulo gulo TaxID=48420 RepID=A0A9X9LX40_GULGU|nr:unnamed protein product [Gulo gulo]